MTPWTAARQASVFFTIFQSLLKCMSIESVMPSNRLILCRPLLLLPSIFPAITVFSNELALCIRWPKYWSFSFRISPSNVYSGLISFRMDWFDLLAVQGTCQILDYSKCSINTSNFLPLKKHKNCTTTLLSKTKKISKELQNLSVIFFGQNYTISCILKGHSSSNFILSLFLYLMKRLKSLRLNNCYFVTFQITPV